MISNWLQENFLAQLQRICKQVDYNEDHSQAFYMSCY